MLNHTNNIRRMPTPSTLSMIRMNRATLDSLDGLFDEPGFIQCVGVDEGLDVVFVADGEAGIDGGWCGSPVFVEFEPDDAGFALFLEGLFVAVVAFAGDAEVQGKGVAGLEHLTNVGKAGCAGCCACSSADTMLALIGIECV